jgi:hypothetical protein
MAGFVHITGTVNGVGIRGVIEPQGDGYEVALGPAWPGDATVV